MVGQELSNAGRWAFDRPATAVNGSGGWFFEAVPDKKAETIGKKQGKTSIPIPNYGLLKLAEVGCKLQNIERFATIKSGLGLITYIQKRL